MGNALQKTSSLQKKSHETLLKMLNNIGVIGAILAAVADLVFVIVMVIGVHVNAELSAIVIYAVVNALIGLLINFLLRYQGQKYAEAENQTLCKRYHRKRIKEKKHLSIGKWMAINTVKDIAIKGCGAAFSIFGVVYISIAGSKNPIQILLTIVTLILFACFGLMSMNSAYTRFYNVQIPLMKEKVGEAEDDDVAQETDNDLELEEEVSKNANTRG